MKYYVFFSLAAIASVAMAGFAFQMYQDTVFAPAPVLIAEVSRAVPSPEVGLPKSKKPASASSNGGEVEPPREVRPPKIESASPPPVSQASDQPYQTDQPDTTDFVIPAEAGINAEVQPPIIEEPLNDSPSESSPAPLPPPAEPPQSAGVRVLISEILYDAAGSDEGKEFIELYNLGEAEVDLNGWSIANGDKTLIKIGSAENDRIKIHARGFFLIGFNKYVGSSDALRSAALPNTSATIMLKDKEGNTMDEMSYGDALRVEKNLGASLERNTGEGTAPFSIQLNPNPQSSY